MKINTNNTPLISVIIPYFNSRIDLFIQAIESVLAQSYKNWETVIVNDGSTIENTNKLTEYVKSLNDKRLWLINLPENHGVSFAKNTGIAASKGEIITFLDADDLYCPWYCQEIINSFNKHSNCLILSTDRISYVSLWKFKNFNSSELFTKLINGEKIKDDRPLLFSAISFKKEVFEKIKYDCEFICSEDTDLMLQIVDNKALFEKVAVAPIIGHLYRLYPSKERLTSQKNYIFKSLEKLLEKYNNNTAISFKLLSKWRTQDEYVKCCGLLNKFFQNYSIPAYLREVLSSKITLKEKFKSIRTLVRVIVIYNFIMPILGINLRYIRTLTRIKTNKYKAVKRKFNEHLKKIEDKKELFYASRLFREIF